MKTKFVYVQPKSNVAKLDFDVLMNRLHSCKVTKEDDANIYLSSISGFYDFWMNKNEDPHWEMIK